MLIGFGLTLTPSSSAQSLNDSLKVHYMFSNNIADSSGGGWHLSALSGAKYTFVADRDGNSKSAIKFTGSNGLRSKRFTNKGWKEETTAMWYKQDGTTGYQVMFQGADLGFAFALRYKTINQVTSFVDGSSGGAFAVPCVVQDTFWHHIAITNNGTLSKIYWDGILGGTIKETLFTGTGTSSLESMFVSCSNSGYAYHGSMDEIVLYSRVLDACEIKELYLQELCPLQVYDTIHVFDTTKVMVYDTTRVTIFDTTHIAIYDTTYVSIFDTMNVTIYDTIIIYDNITIYDTIFTVINDTTFFTHYDTITTVHYDTIRASVTDTLFIDIQWQDSSGKVNRLKVYPNPTNDKITIDFGDFLTALGNRVIIYNIIGQKLFDNIIAGRFMEIDLEGQGFASGNYNLVITNAEYKVLAVKRIILH
jgi:Concanavalin A-like lectin/glucanases superfamily/Secretion system C-terminal sorting domain